jgi:hypothetical protein
LTFYTDGLTDVTVANMALSKIGARSTISSLSENSPEGRLVRLWLTIARSQTLQAYNWSFARKRKTLTLSSDIPDGTDTLWAYRYNYITDALAVREIWNPMGPAADAIPYETEFNTDRTAKTILTNMEDAVGIFTLDVPEVASWPPLALEALATCLAWHIAFPITGNEQMADRMTAQFRYIIATAAAHDGNESIKSAPRDAESIRARQ